MLDNELRVLGFEIESRPFRPHITLGRVKSQKGIEHLISILENLTFEPHASVVNDIVRHEECAETQRVGVLRPANNSIKPLVRIFP